MKDFILWTEYWPANQVCWLHSQSEYMPGLRSRSPVGGAWEATTHWCFSPSFQKIFKKKKAEMVDLFDNLGGPFSWDLVILKCRAWVGLSRSHPQVGKKQEGELGSLKDWRGNDSSLPCVFLQMVTIFMTASCTCSSRAVFTDVVKVCFSTRKLISQFIIQILAQSRNSNELRNF